MSNLIEELTTHRTISQYPSGRAMLTDAIRLNHLAAERIAQLETDLAEARKAMQAISKLHDHEMSGNEIRMNAYDMACIARQFLSNIN